MNHRLLGLPLGLATLAVLAPGAHAGTDVVSNPAPGLASVRISDEDQPGKVLIRATTTTPIAANHFSALFFDTDADGASDVVVTVVKGSSGAAQIHVLSTPQSTADCQQYAGAAGTAISSATTTLANDASGYTVTVPTAQLPGDFRWKGLGAAPDPNDDCQNTDGSVQGTTLSMSDALAFDSGDSTVVVPDTTAPAAPAGLAATAGDGTASLDWADNGESDLGGYLVYRRVAGGAFTLIAQPTTSSYGDSALSNGTTYEYYVRATDATGNLSADSAKVTVTPQGTTVAPPPVAPPIAPPLTVPTVIAPPPVAPKIPAAPKAPKAGAVSSSRVTLDWPAVKGVSKYRIYRRVAHHAWPKTPLATVKQSGYVDKTVKPGVAYEYRIVGVTPTNKLTKPSKSIAVKTKKASKKKSTKKAHR